MKDTFLVEMQAVSKSYPRVGGEDFTALRDINLQLTAGQFIAVIGKSGSGKSTLLNLVSGLDQPTIGTVTVNSRPLHNLSEDALAIWRGEHVGIVFQFFQLLPTLTVLENLMIAMDFRNAIPHSQRREHALNLLDTVEIADQADKLPATLSGGQQQRAAIARALVNDPALLVADEPTGNLDTTTSEAVLGVFEKLVAHGKTLLVVTHDDDLAKHAHTIVRLTDGELTSVDSQAMPGGVR